MQAFKRMQLSALKDLPEEFRHLLTDNSERLRKAAVAGTAAISICMGTILMMPSGQSHALPESHAPPANEDRPGWLDPDFDETLAKNGAEMERGQREEFARIASAMALDAMSRENQAKAYQAYDRYQSNKIEIDWLKETLEQEWLTPEDRKSARNELQRLTTENSVLAVNLQRVLKDCDRIESRLAERGSPPNNKDWREFALAARAEIADGRVKLAVMRP
jgi:hypothetical protein